MTISTEHAKKRSLAREWLKFVKVFCLRENPKDNTYSYDQMRPKTHKKLTYFIYLVYLQYPDTILYWYNCGISVCDKQTRDITNPIRRFSVDEPL